MSIYNYFDASTGHITDRDSEVLCQLAANPSSLGTTISEYDRGWFIAVPEESDGRPDFYNLCRDAGLSEAFINLVAHVRDVECQVLRLDTDGDVLDDLPTFDW